VLAELREGSPTTRTLVLTADPDRGAAQDALDRGADAFVHKTRGMSTLLAAIDRVLAGATVVELPPLRSVPRAKADQAQQLTNNLTERERECLALLLEGASTTEMIARLGVTVTTVRAHVQSVMTKLGVHTRLEAAAYAARYGLVAPAPGEHDAV
jgi:DNA-binding NarL/FixJ family response regulator